MNFSAYYKTVLDTQGIPQLDLDQHRRLFNIIHIEGQLANAQKFKKKEKELPYKYDIEIGKLERKLAELYCTENPSTLMKNMVLISSY